MALYVSLSFIYRASMMRMAVHARRLAFCLINLSVTMQGTPHLRLSNVGHDAENM
ncbi:hypothetical protein [Paraburkholderia sp.]|uniref:hypothetical protein n=1 Tax=Paraburkholderia sp. TaxID=1926495 RepID=UPI0025DE64A6|nr:hypothetical protein [Paraburkholderia sp.]